MIIIFLHYLSLEGLKTVQTKLQSHRISAHLRLFDSKFRRTWTCKLYSSYKRTLNISGVLQLKHRWQDKQQNVKINQFSKMWSS
jgi:hypothetical protein